MENIENEFKDEAEEKPIEEKDGLLLVLESEDKTRGEWRGD